MRSLMTAWQKIAAPCLRAGIRRSGGEHHKGWQIAVHGPQSVADPGSMTWARKLDRTCMCGQRGFVVPVAVADHGIDHADVIDNLAKMRKEIAHRHPALSVGAEVPVRPNQVAIKGTRLVQPATGRHRLAVIFDQLRLVIKRVDMRHAAGRIQKDDSIGPWRKVRLLRRQRITQARLRVFSHQSGQRNGSKST